MKLCGCHADRVYTLSSQWRIQGGGVRDARGTCHAHPRLPVYIFNSAIVFMRMLQKQDNTIFYEVDNLYNSSATEHWRRVINLRSPCSTFPDLNIISTPRHVPPQNELYFHATTYAEMYT